MRRLNKKRFFRNIKLKYLGITNSQGFKTSLIVILFIIVAVIAMLMIEKKDNSNISNLFDTFWYTLVTITTTGYGDIFPVTIAGRLLGIVIMAFGVIIFASVTGNIASFLIDIQQRKGRGLLKLKNMKNHFIICGWKPDFERILKGIIDANPDIDPTNIVLINNAPQEYMETFMSTANFKMLNYIFGDFIEESVLQRASIKTASKVMILADYSQKYSSMEIDSRTILAILTIENLNRTCYTAAELLDEKFESHLKLAHCDEVILSKDYERKLLISASSGLGVSHVVNDLLSYENEKGLNIVDIPSGFIGQKFDNLFTHFYNKGNMVLIGILENTGNFYSRKREALNEAQKNPDIRQIVDNLKKVKELRANNSVLMPNKEYIIKQHSRAIVVGEFHDVESEIANA